MRYAGPKVRSSKKSSLHRCFHFFVSLVFCIFRLWRLAAFSMLVHLTHFEFSCCFRIVLSFCCFCMSVEFGCKSSAIKKQETTREKARTLPHTPQNKYEVNAKEHRKGTPQHKCGKKCKRSKMWSVAARFSCNLTPQNELYVEMGNLCCLYSSI